MPTAYCCLICGNDYSEEDAAEEHVIPNALGGRLKTRQAICRPCNSTTGHSTDAALIRPLAYFAVTLDVPRDRNSHPDLRVPDRQTGLQYIVSAGERTALAPNVQATRSDDVLSLSFFAPTHEEAQRILKRNLPKRDATAPGELRPEQHHTEPYTLDLPTMSYDNVDVLRAVTKIALSYSRHVGLSVPAEACGLKFLRQGHADQLPVAHPRGDVICYDTSPPHALRHSVSIFKEPTSGHLFGYVALFEAYEFLVHLDSHSTLDHVFESYNYDLVSAAIVLRPPSWVVSPDRALDWIGMHKVDHRRFQSRLAALNFWGGRLPELWVQRALTLSSTEYFRALDRGVEPAEALDRARIVANEFLNQYGMGIDEMAIREETTTRHDD